MSDINILVCDDDKEIAGAIEIYLRNEGYNVFKAFDGVQALDIARRQELHLIIMDVMMPNMDGVLPEHNIRSDKWERAAATMNELAGSRRNTRHKRAAEQAQAAAKNE